MTGKRSQNGIESGKKSSYKWEVLISKESIKNLSNRRARIIAIGINSLKYPMIYEKYIFAT